MPRTVETSPEKVLQALGDRDAVTVRGLRESLGVSERTVQRRVQTLLDAGVLVSLGRGIYSRDSGPPTLDPDAWALVETIRDVGADAHLTGYDLLAGYAHQFVYEYAHLVYCHPPHLSTLATELADEEWLVLQAGAGARHALSLDRTVVLRGQPHAPGRYPVAHNLAAPEKAWVDLLREVRRSGLSFDYGELGRLLRALDDRGRPETLTTYARRAGYLDWVRATRGEVPPANAEQRQLAAGYAA
jgi:biotin operon repressor